MRILTHKEIALKYFNDSFHCSQSVLAAYADECDLSIEQALKLGKLVSEAWKKFKKWWDEKQRPEVEAEVRESVMGRLKELKQKTEVSKKVKVEQ